jgi:PAS domain-containing protein
MSLYPLWNWQRINEFLHSVWIAKVHSSTALESIGDGVIITDAYDHVIYINRGAEKILQTRFDQIKGRLLQEILGLHTKPSDSPVTQAEKAMLNTAPDKTGMVEYILKQPTATIEPFVLPAINSTMTKK